MKAATFVVMLLASACSTLPLSDADIADEVATLQPGAVVFIAETEREILRRGRLLTANETRIALAVGVAHPEQVRVLVHGDFIEPRDRAWLALAKKLGVEDDVEQAGRASGHGIEVQARFELSRSVFAHELTHVAQYERLGTAGLLRDYLTQLLAVGYERAPLELEAKANEHIR